MFLTSIRIKNYRSIVDSEDIRIERLQALVGENGGGKSNILTAINAFLSAGAGGVKEQNFYNINEPIVITSTFSQLTDEERKKIRRYLIGDKLILEKHLTLAADEKTRKTKVLSEYHGYEANPKDWWLSVDGVISEKGPSKTPWKAVAEEHGILEYVETPDGKVTKTSYNKGLERLLSEKDDIEYEEAVLGETKALGYASVLVSRLPQFYLLPAITDYSDEIDRRSSSTVFRRLMGDLGDRIIKLDPKYKEIEESLEKIESLLNPTSQADSESGRLKVLADIEEQLKAEIKYLMPPVEKVSLKVELEGTRELFSRGVQLGIDDGKMTDVLDKGHGLQRCVVFGLLKTLIKNERGGLVSKDQQSQVRPIILAIEEPELYIHPQLERLVYGVLKTFASTTGTYDQVIYSTHSPAFVDVWDYHRIGVVRKESVEIGTKVHQCEEGILGTEEEKKGFQLLNSFGMDKNHIFFAKRTVIVEGSQDNIAIIATGRILGLFEELPEELEYSIVVADGKGNVPKFQKLLNAFKLPYVVLLELDGKPETEEENKAILDQLNANKVVKYHSKLEALVGKGKHFANDYQAKVFFSEEKNLCEDLKEAVKDLFA